MNPRKETTPLAILSFDLSQVKACPADDSLLALIGVPHLYTLSRLPLSNL